MWPSRNLQSHLLLKQAHLLLKQARRLRPIWDTRTVSRAAVANVAAATLHAMACFGAKGSQVPIRVGRRRQHHRRGGGSSIAALLRDRTEAQSARCPLQPAFLTGHPVSQTPRPASAPSDTDQYQPQVYISSLVKPI